MLATSSSNLRKNQKQYFNRVVEDRETLIVARRNDENVVVISQAEWESIQETLHLLSSRKNRERLKRSIAQAESGMAVERELVHD